MPRQIAPLPRAFAATLAIALAGCTPSPTAPQVGTVAFAGQTYPIRQVARGWQLIADGTAITCRKATETDCYWSLRNWLHAQDALDELGNPA